MGLHEVTGSGKAQLLNAPFVEREWIVWGAAGLTDADVDGERTDAITDVLGVAPTTIGGLPISDITAEPLESRGWWRILIRWGTGDNVGGGGGPIVEDQEEVTFETTGGVARVKQGLSVTSSLLASSLNNPPDAVPDYGTLVNVTDNGVEGVDLVVPQMRLRIQKGIALADLDNTYLRTLHTLTGTTNNATWRGWSAGEALFLGAQRLRDDGETAEVAFLFAIEPDRTIDIAGFASVSKPGHDYLWGTYARDEDDTANRMVRVPEAVYVTRVYARASWASLGV